MRAAESAHGCLQRCVLPCRRLRAVDLKLDVSHTVSHVYAKFIHAVVLFTISIAVADSYLNKHVCIINITGVMAP